MSLAIHQYPVLIMLIESDTRDIIKLGLKSRLIVFCLQLLFNLLIPDHKSDGFVNGLEAELKTTTDYIVYNLLIGLNRWDSQYFIAIANQGYFREEFLAFFPLFPLSVRFLALILNWIQTLLGQTFVSFYCLLLIASFLLNLLLFVITSVVLYKLTVRLFGDQWFARRAVHWFAYNPSSIFFSSSYTESLFAFFTFSGIYLSHLATDYRSLTMASVAFGLSCGTRSNGKQMTIKTRISKTSYFRYRFDWIHILCANY